MKTTEEHFELFKTAVEEWCRRLHIDGWHIYFAHDELDGNYAQVATSATNRVATITLSTVWDDLYKPTLETIDETAKHEVVHILLAPLRELALNRFATEDQIEAAEEELSRRIDQLIEEGELSASK